nr:MAG TPA: hypothetical protein [Caudoviricetes sp.]
MWHNISPEQVVKGDWLRITTPHYKIEAPAQTNGTPILLQTLNGNLHTPTNVTKVERWEPDEPQETPISGTPLF